MDLPRLPSGNGPPLGRLPDWARWRHTDRSRDWLPRRLRRRSIYTAPRLDGKWRELLWLRRALHPGPSDPAHDGTDRGPQPGASGLRGYRGRAVPALPARYPRGI